MHPSRAIALGLSVAVAASCSQSANSGRDLATAPRDLSVAAQDLAGADLFGSDLSSAGDLSLLPEVTACPVDPMDQLYSGFLPPNPYGAIPAAGACIDRPHDVVIVLGCPNNGDGSPATCQIARADQAAKYFNAGYSTHFITSGAAVANSYVEAVTLKQLLVDRGIPSASILTEQRARHTDENLYFSTRIMEAEGWKSAIVVSEDPGHLILSATCDSNCCVALGRLTALTFTVGGTAIVSAHYVRFPWAAAISTGECDQIKLVTKAMCINLSSRLACASNLQIGSALDAGP